MPEYKRYLVTAALPYTNGPIHIGHLAGVYVPADIYVRYLKLKYGKDKVVFVCGSDEHGVPITLAAKKENVSPQVIVDRYHAIIQKSFIDFGIEFDIYHRTSDPLHHQTATDFFTKLYNDGVFVEKETEQYFDESEQIFLADRYIIGTCPKCNNENAYGDQCEKCGSTLSPDELLNPRSALSGTSLIKRKTRHWFLPLDKIQKEWLNEWVLQGTNRWEDWKKHVLGQSKSWLEQGLQPRAITRDGEWGVKVPLPDAAGKVLYVWFDAPIGYISATKAWAQQTGNDWEPYWKDSETKLVHFIGKDNIVFHTIIFPAMLYAHGGYILPTNIPANEFMNLEGDKMSTSRNWTVWLHDYMTDFPRKQDTLRYVITTLIPETKDSEFTWKDFQRKNNNELVATFGNFINRVMVLTHKYCSGKVPVFNPAHVIISHEQIGKTSDYFAEIGFFSTKTKEIETALEQYRFRDGLSLLIEMAAAGNALLQFNEPWKKIITDAANVQTVLNLCLQIVRFIATAGTPFLPSSIQRIRKMLNIPADIAAGEWEKMLTVSEDFLLPAGNPIGEPELLFEKIDDEAIEKQAARLAMIKAGQKPAAPAFIPLKSSVNYETFAQLDLRIATIKHAETIKGADKLLKLILDLGFEERTVVSGIAQQYSPDDIIGKQILLLANLEPRKLRGIESQGMILLAEDMQGKLIFVHPATPTDAGSIVK